MIKTKTIQHKVNRLIWELQRIKTISKLIKQININVVNYTTD